MRRVAPAFAVAVAATLVAAAAPAQAARTQHEKRISKARSEIAIPGAGAADLAAAMEGTGASGFVAGAEFTSGPSAPDAVGLAGSAGLFFPSDGGSSALLTTGDVANAGPPNESESSGVENGTSERGVNDPTTLRVDVDVPAGRNCLSFDVAFYSEEFKEYIGSEYNDAFVAELDRNDWSYEADGDTLTAPGNFAFDTNGRQLTVNTVLVSSEETGLEYDGSTVLLKARAQVQPGRHSIYFTIYDAGDHVFDSAAFLDNLRPLTLPADQCRSGVNEVDTDKDALPDEWERSGADTNGDGSVDLDLPAMGATPDHKDLFVELDAMQNHHISASTIQKVVDAFAAAPLDNPDGSPGVRLHVDGGPDFEMKPGETWGARSRGATIPHTDVLGRCEWDAGCVQPYEWEAVDRLKEAHFDRERWPVFRYAVSAHRYGHARHGSSGIARGIGGSDFIVSLGHRDAVGDRTVAAPQAQAGTFMHELGHTLGLRHGGSDDFNDKSNYLSVMNYSYQFSGIPTNGAWPLDFSRFGRPGEAANTLLDLDEGSLDESVGFGGVGDFAGRYRANDPCAPGTVSLTGAVDWNCDGQIETDVSAELNQEIDDLLTHLDWDGGLRFRGGAVGGLGLAATLPATTEPQDTLTLDELEDRASELAGDLAAPTIKVSGKRTVRAPARVKLKIRATDPALQALYVRIGGKKAKAGALKPGGIATFTVKLKKGKQRITILAEDASGNERVTKVTAQVKKRKRR